MSTRFSSVCRPSSAGSVSLPRYSEGAWSTATQSSKKSELATVTQVVVGGLRLRRDPNVFWRRRLDGRFPACGVRSAGAGEKNHSLLRAPAGLMVTWSAGVSAKFGWKGKRVSTVCRRFSSYGEGSGQLRTEEMRAKSCRTDGSLQRL